MDSARAPFEPTTTLHLGVRGVVETPGDSVSNLISQSTSEEKAVLEGILSGASDHSMIVIHRGPSKGARFLITSTGATIGRAPQSDIFLDDITVSRAHAKIELRESGFHFIDLGSLNGSYINNESSTEHTLVSGDEIQVGKFHMLFIGASQKSDSTKITQ